MKKNIAIIVLSIALLIGAYYAFIYYVPYSEGVLYDQGN